MTVLMEVQGFAQAVADAISAVAGVEVAMVDENLLTVVGSGKYARHIGRTLEKTSVSARALAEGRTMVIQNPQYDDVCRPCTQKDKCTDVADIICPIMIEGRPAGCVILVACTASQKGILISDMQRWINFLERMADLISRAFNERQQTARAEGLARQLDIVIDSVNDGILTIDGAGTILHANQSAARLLKVTRDQLASCLVDSVFPQLSSDTLGETSSSEFETYSCVRGNREYWLTTVRPIADDFCPHGHVVTFRGIEEIPRMVANYIRSERHSTFDDMLGSSAAMTSVKSIAASIAEGDSTVLIQGESGTGKELLARAIYHESARRQGPFVAVNCAAIPESILESELFGYEEGAFTGAKRGGKPGKFELANGGVLFLDEIGDMPLHLQGKLLRAVEGRVVDRLGGRKAVPIDIRIISATNKDLRKLSMRGGFRPDLFYRLAVIPIVIPPLRDHREDIPEYVDHFVAKYARDLRRNVTLVSPAAMAKLTNYDWPGNIRELSDALEYAVNLATGTVIDTDCLPCQVLCPPSADAALGSGSVPCARSDLGSDRDSTEYPIGLATKRGMTRSALADALERYGTSTRAKEAIAAAFGVSRATLYRRLREYGL